MGIVLIGIIYLFACTGICIFGQGSPKLFISGFIVACIAMIISFATVQPAAYSEPILVNEVALVPFDENVSTTGDGNIFYVSVTSTNIYSYR